MIDVLGLIMMSIGILFMIISIYFLNLIIARYLKKEKFKVYFYLAIIFMIISLIYRIYIIFYVDYLTAIGLPQEVLIEKILFLRVFLHIPFAIAFTFLLIVCYGCLTEIKYKLSK